jgi:3-oxoacyl-[acyl-carrier protein] reductase
MKNVLITGTSRGIGEQLAIKFAQNNYRVIAVSRKKSSLLNLANIHQISIDLSKAEEISLLKKELENYQNIDIVINNAGKLIHKPFLELETQDFLDIYHTNVLG